MALRGAKIFNKFSLLLLV